VRCRWRVPKPDKCASSLTETLLQVPLQLRTLLSPMYTPLLFLWLPLQVPLMHLLLPPPVREQAADDEQKLPAPLQAATVPVGKDR